MKTSKGFEVHAQGASTIGLYRMQVVNGVVHVDEVCRYPEGITNLGYLVGEPADVAMRFVDWVRREGGRSLLGVYRHAEWQVEDHATGNGRPRETEPANFVVREVSRAVPYGRMVPIRAFVNESPAKRCCDEMNAALEAVRT